MVMVAMIVAVSMVSAGPALAAVAAPLPLCPGT